jgi:hypothetical protein
VPSSKVARFKPSPFVGQDAAAHCRSVSSGFSFVSDTRRLGGRAGRNRFDCALTNLGRGASDAHGHLHPPVLDASASRLITGRFVLLPKNLVTGVAKTRIVSRPTRRGAGFPLEGDYLEAPAESGLLSGRFLADANPCTRSTRASCQADCHIAEVKPHIARQHVRVNPRSTHSQLAGSMLQVHERRTSAGRSI